MRFHDNGLLPKKYPTPHIRHIAIVYQLPLFSLREISGSTRGPSASSVRLEYLGVRVGSASYRASLGDCAPFLSGEPKATRSPRFRQSLFDHLSKILDHPQLGR